MSNSSNFPPKKIVLHMLKNDAFSQWLGIELVKVEEGQCSLRCKITDEMLNGYNIAHGGILFSLADSAIAFASATYGRIAVAIDHSISFIKKAVSGDILSIKAEAVSMGFKTGVIRVEIKNQKDELVAVVKGAVYRTDEMFEL